MSINYISEIINLKSTLELFSHGLILDYTALILFIPIVLLLGIIGVKTRTIANIKKI